MRLHDDHMPECPKCGSRLEHRTVIRGIGVKQGWHCPQCRRRAKSSA